MNSFAARILLLAALLTGVAGCQAGNECQTESDCDGGEICVTGGGLLFGGGRCLPDQLGADAGPPHDTSEAVDADLDGDAADLDAAEQTDALDVSDAADTDDTSETSGECSRDALGADADADLFWYRDGDGDGFGDRQESLLRCSAPTAPGGYVEQAGDCNDEDPTVNPAADELCSGNVDRDCDGQRGCVDTDCDGKQCAGAGTACLADDCKEKACEDGNDNDNDGRADRNDPDCGLLTGGAKCGPQASCQSGECVDGRCAQRIIVTSKKYNGDFGGVAGADMACQSLLGPMFGGTWRAIVSVEGKPAKPRLTIDGPLYNTNGDLLGENSAELWSSQLKNPVGYDESGIPSTALVWTATENTGKWDGFNEMEGEDCAGWTSGAALRLGEVGKADRKDGGWSIAQGTDGMNELRCNKSAALYCIDGQ